MTAVSIGDGEFTVDSALVAEGFGLTEEKLHTLMSNSSITSCCETGEGADAGHTRLNFIYGNQILRLTIDAAGNLIEPARIDFTSFSQLDHRRFGGGGDKL